MACLSINEVTTYRWSFDQDVERYKAAGITAIGVWRQKLADYGEQCGIELLARSGLKVSNLVWAGGYTGSNGHSYDESLDDTREAIELASALGTNNLVVYSGARNGHTQNHARRIFVSALVELLPMAERLGVRLAIEPMHSGCAEDWTFLTGLDDAMALLHQVDSPYLRLAFDTYHLGHDPAVVEQIAAVAPYIGIVHLGDGQCPRDHEQNRHCLGEGALPLSCIVRALKQAGYDGYYDVELMGEAIEACDYGQLLERTRQTFNELLSD
jgi:sugar phosphate isomerase/epimerase